MKRLLFIVLLAVATGCACKRNTVAGSISKEEHNHSNIERIIDSIYIEHQVMVETKGDTVYVRNDSIVHHYHNETVHDTVTSATTDTIYKPVIPDGYAKPDEWDVFWEKSGKLAWIILLLMIAAGIVAMVIKLKKR